MDTCIRSRSNPFTSDCSHGTVISQEVVLVTSVEKVHFVGFKRLAHTADWIHVSRSWSFLALFKGHFLGSLPIGGESGWFEMGSTFERQVGKYIAGTGWRPDQLFVPRLHLHQTKPSENINFREVLIRNSLKSPENFGQNSQLGKIPK